MHFRARGGETSEELSPEGPGPRGGRPGPDRLGRSFDVQRWGFQQEHAKCIHTVQNTLSVRAGCMCAVLGRAGEAAKREGAERTRKEATTDEAEGSRRPSVAACEATRALRDPCASGRQVSGAPRGGQRGRSQRSPLLRLRGALLPSSSFPARLSPRPLPFPLPDRDGRGLPPPPPLAARRQASKLQGLWSRVPGSGRELAAAGHKGTSTFLSAGPRGGRGGTRRGFSCAASPARPARPAASWELEGRGRAWLSPRPAWSWTGAV